MSHKNGRRKKQFLTVANIVIRAKPVQSKAAKLAKLHVNQLRCLTFGSSFSSICRVSTSCSSLSDSGKGARVWGRRESERREPPLLSPVSSLLSCSRFLNSAGATISEPGTGYKSTVYAHCIFVVIGSLFLNIRLHLILNNRKKEVREEEKS